MNKKLILKNFTRLKTQYAEGLTEVELNHFLLKHTINKNLFLNLLGCNTVMIINQTTIIYKHDIEKCLMKILSN